MDTIELIKKFESSGFSRTQAEVQVKTMVDLKNGLLTQKDGQIIYKNLSKSINFLGEKINLVDRNLGEKIDLLDTKFGEKIGLLDTKFGEKIDLLDTKFDAKIDALDKRVDSLETSMKDGFILLRDEIRLQPLRIIIYLLGVMGSFLGLYSFWPMFKSWLQF